MMIQPGSPRHTFTLPVYIEPGISLTTASECIEQLQKELTREWGPHIDPVSGMVVWLSSVYGLWVYVKTDVCVVEKMRRYSPENWS